MAGHRLAFHLQLLEMLGKLIFKREMPHVHKAYGTLFFPEEFNKETFGYCTLNIYLSNKEKNVTSIQKCLRRVDAKDKSEFFRVIKRLEQGTEM